MRQYARTNWLTRYRKCEPESRAGRLGWAVEAYGASQQNIWSIALRSRRPPQSTIDQVHILREGDYAIIEHADTAYGTTRLLLGPMVNNLTDAEILEIFNEIISAQEASVTDPANRPVEIPRGRPQIEWQEDFQQWSARGHVLRCHVSDDEDRNLVVYIDDKELDAEAFLDLIKPFAGWGMRITFMDETQVYDEPSVIVRDPDSSD